MAKHLTAARSNDFSRATMLRQVALVRDYGDGVAEAVQLLDCHGCDWRRTAVSHQDAVDQRLEHEQATGTIRNLHDVTGSPT